LPFLSIFSLGPSLQIAWETIVTIIYLMTIVYALYLCIQVIFDNRPPEKTITWVLLLLLLPMIGIIVYFFIGQNFRKQKIFSRKGIADFMELEALKQQKLLFSHKFLPSNISTGMDEKVLDKLNVITLMLNNSKALLSIMNEVEVLNNGDRTFSSILQNLEKAEHHIHIEYFILEEGQLMNSVKEILLRKAKDGVEIRVIYDGVGSRKLSKALIAEFEAVGIEIYCFMPVRFPYFTSRINNRNHRKIIVIDGKIGFVGGLNIADRYLFGVPELGQWRDTHLRIDGDAVKSLQAIFLIDWFFVSKKVLNEVMYFPKVEITNKCLIQIVASGPDSDWASIMQSYFAAITTAKKYIYISTPYFLPNESILTAIKTASMSGVDVRVILPDKSDTRIVLLATKSYIRELLDADIKIYLYHRGFVHSKLLIVDDIFASVGTTNMDVRSFDENFEVNAIIYNSQTAIDLKNTFLDDLKDSRLIKRKYWKKRPRLEKAKESVARIFSPLF
jgi:cardiolipin synthase A/B